MDIQSLTAFFMWLTIINFIILLLSTIIIVLAQDFAYRVHATMFNISREAFNIIVYSYLGLYKILFLSLCLAPYLALLIIG